jgi:hypothetical protein
MPTEPKTVTREELYEQVWSKPAVQLAAEYGVSDVAIGKACKRLNVPRPPSGYWGTLKAGLPVEKPPLPNVVLRGRQSTTISGAARLPAPKPRKPALTDIEVPDDLEGCHEFVSKTWRAMQKCNP